MRKRNSRDYLVVTLISAIFLLFIVRLGYIQIVNGKTYAAAGENVSAKAITVKASRGEILDRNGEPLVTNRQGNAIIFDASEFPSAQNQEDRNAVIIRLIRLFEHSDKKDEWHDILPLEVNKSGQISFKKDSENEIVYLKSKGMLHLNSYATAENCMDALIKRYSLESYSLEEARLIASVCYGMFKSSFNVSRPYVFADDVSTVLVSKIKENSYFLQGVDVDVVTYREYADGTLAPHILGMTGALNAEEYKKLKDTYAMNDIIGKNGIELAMESVLKGTDGIKTVFTDTNGNTTTEYTKNPIQGNSVILTIDSKLQKVAQSAVENCLKEIKKTEKDKVSSAIAGSAVVIKIGTGEVLAATTYPSYDISKYSENYSKLAKDNRAPLWNRAFQSTYTPGSTMKPAIAVAALEEGVINSHSTISCSGFYRYRDITLRCTATHGALGVISAINYSCNIFFYDLGKNLGIDIMNTYRKYFGLGQKTGIEIEEATGTLDSPTYRQSLNQTWYPGFTLQSAIGNAGDICSPLQLANYCATIANGGSLYKCTLIKSVKSYDWTKTISENEPVLLRETTFSKNTMDNVRKGMHLVGTKGFCADVFRSLTVEAAAKTGTSQVEKTFNGVKKLTNNGFLITFAPYENPEIAICVALEGASSGTSVAPVAKDIYNYYFASKKPQANDETEKETVKETTTIIKNNENILLP